MDEGLAQLIPDHRVEDALRLVAPRAVGELAPGEHHLREDPSGVSRAFELL